MVEYNKLTHAVIGTAIAVHKQLGPGLLESVYQKCMEMELASAGLKVAAEVAVPVVYKGIVVSREAFRVDLLVEDELVVELKSVDVLKDVHKKQVLTYLRLLNKPLGLLINFNESRLTLGIERIANGFDDAVAF